MRSWVVLAGVARFVLPALAPFASGCGSDDGGGGGPDAAVPDAPAGGADAPAAADVGPAPTFQFDLEPATVSIVAGQPELFHLTNIRTTGIDLTSGVHYHVFLDSPSNPYLIYSSATPDSPDVEIPSDTPAGAHEVVGALEDADHQALGIQSSKTLTVVVP